MGDGDRSQVRVKGPLSVSACADEAAFARLRGDWTELARRASAAAAQTWDYAETAWRHRSRSIERLHLLEARQDGVLVGLWALAVTRGKGGLALVRPIGSGSLEEYGEPLIDPAADQAVVADGLLRAAGAGGDVLEVYNIGPWSPLRPAIADLRHWPSVPTDVACPRIHLAGQPSWADWLAAKSSSFRQGLRYDRKRLDKQGALTFHQVGPSDAGALIDWCFAVKRKWLDDRGIGDNWLRRPQSAAFFGELVGQGKGVEGFYLALDGRMIAGSICLRSPLALEFFITCFDEAFKASSPGNLLIEDICRWCFGQGLDFDFRITSAGYKTRWSDAAWTATSYSIATAPRGRGLVRRKKLERLARRTKAWAKPIVKRLLRRS